MTTTYRLEVSSDSSANPNSSRPGLWRSEGLGESDGLTREQGEKAAEAALEWEGVESVRLVDEATGEVVYAI
jgi:hypothetical protein